jgi:outer membrane protein assembly factor BamB
MGRLVLLIIGMLLTFIGQSQQEITEEFPLKWKVKIGVTTYRTNMVFHEGNIYVGSNGEDRNAKLDKLDGVYKVDAKLGTINHHFQTQLLGDNDVNGVVIGNGRIYFGGDDRHFYCFDLETKNEIWKRHVGFEVESCPVLADMNGDEKLDVIFNAEGSGLTVLDGITGKLIWFNDTITNHSGNMTPAVLDLNGDGTPDVVTAGRGKPNSSKIDTWKMSHYGDYHFALDGKTGNLVWVQESGAGIHASPCIRVKDQVITIAGLDAYGELTYIDHKGNQIFGASYGYDCFSSPILSKNDRLIVGSKNTISVTGIAPEYILTHEEGHTYITEDAPYKSIEMGGKLSATPVVADILGNGKLQMIVADESGNLVIADEDANELKRFKLTAGAEASCYIGDIDQDGQLELLVADLDGYLSCYDTKSAGEVFWGSYRGNKLNTGVANVD